MRISAKVLMGLLAIGLLPLSAATILITSEAGFFTTRIGATTITFNGLAGLGGSSYTEGIATYTWEGADGSPFVNGSVDGQYATPPVPPADNSDYLTVGSPGRPQTVSISFSFPIAYFGMYMGSPDAYNSVTFFSGDDSDVFSGTTLFPGASGDQSTGRYINFDFSDGSIDRIDLSSTMPALETDNHAYIPTPEPSTYAMMGLCMTLAGVLGRKVRKA